MNTYKVVILCDGNENLPYSFPEVVAKTKNMAIAKAKKFVARNGWFPGLSEKVVMRRLSAKSAEKVS